MRLSTRLANPFKIDWPFIYQKGFRTSFLDKMLPDTMIRNTRIDGMSFYHYKALPPKDIRYLRKDEENYEVALRLKGNIAIDCGAHIGSYALRLARNFRWVFAFEPNPSTNYLLRLNVKRNGIRNIDVMNVAVSDRRGSTMLRIPSRFSPGSSIAEKHYEFLDFDRQVMVTTTSLDDFVHQSMGQIDFVKIDVEGHELEVLNGMEWIVKKHHPILSVEVHREPDSGVACECAVCIWIHQHYSNVKGKYPVGENVHWIICN